MDDIPLSFPGASEFFEAETITSLSLFVCSPLLEAKIYMGFSFGPSFTTYWKIRIKNTNF
jgi:hypothetical protein